MERNGDDPVLDGATVDRVLEALGLASRPPVDLAGLGTLYGAWCRSVPFDNLRKRVHVAAADPGPLPGDEPGEMLEAWLEHRCGATCWGGHGAWHALLTALGFPAVRAIATMLVVPDLPPNHGSVAVRLGDVDHLVDASMLHQEPLPLVEGARIDHPAWGVDVRRVDGCWHVRWRPPWMQVPLDCRIDRLGATAAEFRALHEQTRPWSPFNYQLNFRLNRPEGVIGLAFGQRFFLSSDGEVELEPVDDAGRRRFLAEAGIGEALIARLPADQPTPPPPWSATALSDGGDGPQAP